MTGLLLATLAGAADEDLVFRSDVSLVRVDTQVVDRNNRAVTGLQQEDFVLFEGGKQQEIRNFANEDMPVDVLLLLDVSGSMQSHIQRLSDASHQALRVLNREDRVAVMVFDRVARLRLPFRSNLDQVEREFENVLNQETFNGGTDINRGLLEAASYMGREGRREARRAIIILTDDQTERGRDEDRMTEAIHRSDSVLSAILAPDAMGGRYGGGGWPGSGGGMGGPLGGIILGRRGPYGGRGGGGSGPVVLGPRVSSAGTAEIARRTGGDSMNVDDAGAFENTLSRIRQRYALHFNLAEGVQPGQVRDIRVELADAAARRYPGSEVRSRRMYSGSGRSGAEPVEISRTPTNPRPASGSADSSPGLRRRRQPVNEDGTRIESGGGWPRSDEVVAEKPPVAPSEPPQRGGWRRIKPGEEP